MTDSERREIEETILSYGRATAEVAYAETCGAESQIEFARANAEEAWFKVLDTIEEIVREIEVRMVMVA